MSKGKILWFSDSPLTTTGYATISRNICNGLTEKGWEIHYISHNYLGQTLKPEITFTDNTKCNFTLWGQGVEPYCRDVLVPRIREIRPDIFCTLLDTFMVYPQFLQTDFAPAKTVFYFPSDGGEQLPQNCESILKRMNKSVAMAKFGQKQAKQIYNLDVDYIPHAVNEKIFFPLSEEQKQINRLKWKLKDKFVVGTVARNQGRKMLDKTIKAFKEFCKDKPDAILFLHLDPMDRAQSFDMISLIQRLKLENRVMFSGTNFFKGFDYNQMNEIYNLFDVFILSTSGEGFGVPIIEAMSCQIPVVMTDYTTAEELIIENNTGLVAEVNCEITGSWNVERAIVNEKSLATQLQTLYFNKELRKKLGENGRKAVLKDYTWENIINQWDEYFTKLKNGI